MLYPIMTISRMKIALDGIWDFKLIKDRDKEFTPGRRIEEALAMPVPCSYNDLYESKSFRDHVGDMIYQRELSLSTSLLKERIVLYFGSVTHYAEVYINYQLVYKHKGGFLPFEVEINSFVKPGKNLLTVLVNNIVDETTLPCGGLVTRNYPGMPPKVVNEPHFDFFNYSGIMRPVCLYTTPSHYIEDIMINAHADGSFEWQIKTSHPGLLVQIYIKDKDEQIIWKASGDNGQGKLEKNFSWSPNSPYLYTFCVSYGEDYYEEPFGFRDIKVENCHLMLNGAKVYLKGFGKHEDSPINGRGYNAAYNVKDINLMKWIGANSLRTSHYPYSEEFMRLCDREGILVIDEVPAVGLHTGFTAVGLLGGEAKGTWATLKTASHHREVIEQLIARDKNHPCVVMWSVANEPASEEEGAKEYFEPLMQLARKCDPQKRPVTIVTYEKSSPTTCKVAELCDVLVLNRYRGWYDTVGDLPAAAALLKEELEQFHKRCPDKPIMLGEYGADTISGVHNTTASLFSEEYQMEFIKAYTEVFDSLSYITGEHVWNFADFSTAENIKRVQGNKKGIFTRQRQPKMAAQTLKQRWHSL